MGFFQILNAAGGLTLTHIYCFRARMVFAVISSLQLADKNAHALKIIVLQCGKSAKRCG